MKDISEFLYSLGAVKPAGRIEAEVTYHDACHLCHGQQVRHQPRALLQMIDGLKLKPLEETEICCGAAGTYNLTEPEMSHRLGQRKAGYIEATGASMVATGNVGCQLQIQKHLADRGQPMKVVHPVELLDQAYGPIPQ